MPNFNLSFEDSENIKAHPVNESFLTCNKSNVESTDTRGLPSDVKLLIPRLAGDIVKNSRGDEEKENKIYTRW